ncbi:MAG: UDP-galactopyranose mutase [Chlorobi bacterium]|nr:UDP-galactopyranose mutase [Chlorobiota bacterium]
MENRGRQTGILDNGSIRNANMATIPAFTRAWSIPGAQEADAASGNNVGITGEPDIICFSRLRWDFVFQRPHHLLSRCAADHRVFFVEEAVLDADDYGRLEINRREHGVWVVVPHLPADVDSHERLAHFSDLLSDLIRDRNISEYILWYCSAGALAFTRHLEPISIIYDCDGPDGGTPMHEDEAELSARADLIFTVDNATYEQKRNERSNVFAFPNGIDRVHFAGGRNYQDDPLDQVDIPHPRLGFFGVIDNRLDFALIDSIAEARPDWNLVLVGPIETTDSATALPCRSNIHYLGARPYGDIPAYLSGWNVAMLPLRTGEGCHISPTRIPECLAAGVPVVATSFRDALHPYGESGLIATADTLAEFIIAAAESGMDESIDSECWFEKVDRFLSGIAWENTWKRMKLLIDSTTEARRSTLAAPLLRSAGIDPLK